MLELLGLAGDDFAQTIFARCGVERRHFELTPDTLGTTLQERTVADGGAAAAARDRGDRRARARPGSRSAPSSPRRYYSLGGPTLAHKLLAHYGMDPATDKYHVVGVGCASAVPLFKIASQSMRDHPGKHALVVAAESITGFLTRRRRGRRAGQDDRLLAVRRRLRGRRADERREHRRPVDPRRAPAPDRRTRSGPSTSASTATTASCRSAASCRSSRDAQLRELVDGLPRGRRHERRRDRPLDRPPRRPRDHRRRAARRSG